MYAQGRVLSDLCHVCDAPGRGGSLGRLGRGLATSAEPLAHHNVNDAFSSVGCTFRQICFLLHREQEVALFTMEQQQKV